MCYYMTSGYIRQKASRVGGAQRASFNLPPPPFNKQSEVVAWGGIYVEKELFSFN